MNFPLGNWQFYLCFLNSYEIGTKKPANYIYKVFEKCKKEYDMA